MREVDMDLIRVVGLTDHKIGHLTDSDITIMNETELMVTAHSYLDNADILCQRHIRMGFIGDGGWEICDDPGVRLPTQQCLVYSFGVVPYYSFEDDVARVYKCEVHSFNSNLEGEDLNRSNLITVHPYSIGRWSEITPSGMELYTLNDIKTILGHEKRNIDLIKMDIEGGEWPSLSGILLENQLSSVKQLLVEFHVGFPPNEERLRRSLRVLRSISEAGFRKFYVHKNPRGSFHHPLFPVVRAKNYEIHYINTKLLK